MKKISKRSVGLTLSTFTAHDTIFGEKGFMLYLENFLEFDD